MERFHNESIILWIWKVFLAWMVVEIKVLCDNCVQNILNLFVEEWINIVKDQALMLNLWLCKTIWVLWVFITIKVMEEPFVNFVGCEFGLVVLWDKEIFNSFINNYPKSVLVIISWSNWLNNESVFTSLEWAHQIMNKGLSNSISWNFSVLPTNVIFSNILLQYF
jgi:hypothetical protein